MSSITKLSSEYFWGGLRTGRTYSHWPVCTISLHPLRFTAVFHLYYNYDFNHSVLKFSMWLKYCSVLIYITSRLVKFLINGGSLLYPEVLSPSRSSLCLSSPPLVFLFCFSFSVLVSSAKMSPLKTFLWLTRPFQ